MNGDSFAFLAEEFLRPLNASLDYLFVIGAVYGAKHLLGFAWQIARGVRAYLVPFGRCTRSDFTEELGKWAGKLIRRCLATVDVSMASQ